MNKHNHELTPQQQQALEYLTLARKTRERAEQDRAYWAALARRHGLPWAAIGNALGISDAGARMLVTRQNAEAKKSG